MNIGGAIIIDGKVSNEACERIEADMIFGFGDSLRTWQGITHLAKYMVLPDALRDLGLLVPDNQVHALACPHHSGCPWHSHPWDAFIFFPADHPQPLIVNNKPIDVVKGRLVFVPADVPHEVFPNLYPEPRLSIASELRPS
jgi:hypothetical protein